MSGKRNVSVCSGHELVNALYMATPWPQQDWARQPDTSSGTFKLQVPTKPRQKTTKMHRGAPFKMLTAWKCIRNSKLVSQLQTQRTRSWPPPCKLVVIKELSQARESSTCEIIPVEAYVTTFENKRVSKFRYTLNIKNLHDSHWIALGRIFIIDRGAFTHTFKMGYMTLSITAFLNSNTLQYSHT